jgi:hypothetical protein
MKEQTENEMLEKEISKLISGMTQQTDNEMLEKEASCLFDQFMKEDSSFCRKQNYIRFESAREPSPD